MVSPKSQVVSSPPGTPRLGSPMRKSNSGGLYPRARRRRNWATRRAAMCSIAMGLSVVRGSSQTPSSAKGPGVVLQATLECCGEMPREDLQRTNLRGAKAVGVEKAASVTPSPTEDTEQKAAPPLAEKPVVAAQAPPPAQEVSEQGPAQVSEQGPAQVSEQGPPAQVSEQGPTQESEQAASSPNRASPANMVEKQRGEANDRENTAAFDEYGGEDTEAESPRPEEVQGSTRQGSAAVEPESKALHQGPALIRAGTKATASETSMEKEKTILPQRAPTRTQSPSGKKVKREAPRVAPMSGGIGQARIVDRKKKGTANTGQLHTLHSSFLMRGSGELQAQAWATPAYESKQESFLRHRRRGEWTYEV
ncbi:unnamed protein product [Amoebophrya sp. A25]|nr:unnamed protein product [Amoebophrya sp. A25]|eukprot:GSA25T00017135001.1